jgi:N utilization substance protein B
MLNRRNLRIKAMQTLFAFQQLRASDQLIVEEQLKQDIQELPEQPDNSIEWVNLLRQHIDGSQVATSELNDMVSTAVSSYHQKVEADLAFLRSQMVKEVEGIYTLFLWVMNIFPALADHEDAVLSRKRALPQGKPKVHLPCKIALEIIRNKLKTEKIATWADHQDRISQWYKEVKEHTTEESLPHPNHLEEESKWLRYMFKSIMWKSESFQNFFEAYDRGWVENKDIIKSLVNKTLKSISDEGMTLAPLSYQWEEDKQFFLDIFDQTIKKESWAEKLIAESAKNWELDRIAQVDMILLKMALCEMINFPSIPVKVTINEYIELSKKYSTPKSKKFVNGILDVLANDLVANGTVKKSGRGLIDNK